MARLILCPLFFLVICSEAQAERLLLGHSVIYREATDDYLFRAQFNYPVSDPNEVDAGMIFWIMGPRPSDGQLRSIAYVGDFGCRDEMLPSITRYVPEPPVIVGNADLFVESNVVEFVAPRSALLLAGDIALLFPYHIGASTIDGELQYSAGVPNPFMTQLNVPEPSSVLITAAAVAPLSILARRRLRNIRAT
jgi:hypothetical protein